MLYTYGLCPLLEGSRTNIIWCHTLMVPFASVGDLISFKLPEKVCYLKWFWRKMSNFDQFHSKFGEFFMKKWSFLNDFKQKWQFSSKIFKNRWWHIPLKNTIRVCGWPDILQASEKVHFLERSWAKMANFDQFLSSLYFWQNN